jgi:hypothetical protein
MNNLDRQLDRIAVALDLAEESMRTGGDEDTADQLGKARRRAEHLQEMARNSLVISPNPDAHADLMVAVLDLVDGLRSLTVLSDGWIRARIPEYRARIGAIQRGLESVEIHEMPKINTNPIYEAKSIFVGPTPPPHPEAGSIWIDSDTMVTHARSGAAAWEMLYGAE